MSATRFFTYGQNNSGGVFVHDDVDGIGYFVIVEATSADHANARAERIGLYFDGCDKGVDCSCCGDRWDRAYGDGDQEPTLYGEPIDEAANRPEGVPGTWWGLPVFVHYLGERGVVRYQRPEPQP